jgi:MFS family permease
MLQVLTVAILLFIITVVQNWIKQYLTEVLLVSEKLSDLCFIGYALTALPIGIISGGFIVQKIGGYSSLKSSYYVAINTLICVGLAVVIAFVHNLIFFSIVFWLFLFFGAAIIPALDGGILSALPAELKGSGYSFQNVTSNIIGLSPAPTIYGIIYEATSKSTPTLALTLCLATSGIGFILMLIVISLRRKKLAE